MKYALIVLSGAGDEPSEALGGRTPLTCAQAPGLASIASGGRVGAVRASPAGREPSAALGLATLLGVDAQASGLERGPVEALGAGIDLEPGQVALSAALISVAPGSGRAEAGVVQAPEAPGLAPAEARELFRAVGEAWRSRGADLASGLRISPTGGARAVVVDASGASYNGAVSTGPASAQGAHYLRAIPTGDRADALRALMEASLDALAGHEINAARVENGLPPANMLWLWGAGAVPACVALEASAGVRAACVGTGLACAGLARLLGAERIVPPEGDPASQASLVELGEQAREALGRFDLVVVHIEAPAMARDALAKVRAIEAADRLVAAPLLERLRGFGDAEADPLADPGAGWRALAAVDFAQRCGDGAPLPGPVPFALAGAWVRRVLERPFSEEGAADTDLVVDPGHDLLEYFLYGGLVGARARRRQPAKGRA